MEPQWPAEVGRVARRVMAAVALAAVVLAPAVEKAAPGAAAGWVELWEAASVASVAVWVAAVGA